MSVAEQERTIPAPEWCPTNEEYHQLDGRWSSSMVKDFRACPALARDRYVEQCTERKSATKAMDVGSAVHSLVLGGPEVVRVDVPNRRHTKKLGKAADDHPDAIILTAPEFAEAQAIVSQIKKPKTPAARAARALLLDVPGENEFAVQAEVDGIKVKAMADRLVELEGQLALIEFKTTGDPRPDRFQRHAYNMEYHCQAAFYQRVFEARFGDRPRVIYVVQRSGEPFDPWPYEPTAAYFEKGHEQIATDLAALKQALATGEWMTDHERLLDGSLLKLDLPAFAKRRETLDFGLLGDI